MNPIKIIFFDIDGTLVDPQTGRISDKTAEALIRLHENGIKICIATGRPPASLPNFHSIHIDSFSTCSGSLCYSGEEIIFSLPLPPCAVDMLVQNAATVSRPVSVADARQLAANGYDRDLGDYYALAGLTLTPSSDFEEVCSHPIYQIMIGCTKEQHQHFIENVPGVKLSYSWERAVDVINRDAGKATAVQKILEYYHLEPSQALAFGDSYNDLDMLRAVGTGVAMGNAIEKLKSVADDVCGHVHDDGIYHYCLAKGLI